MSRAQNLLDRLNLKPVNEGACFSADGWIVEPQATPLVSISPSDGRVIGEVCLASTATYHQLVAKAEQGFLDWRMRPAPQRGQMVRDLGNLLREYAEPLGELVSWEMGKIRAEGIGEVQEMIDICDFAVGLSRQLCGSTMHSERPLHRMYEQWHPLGPIGIISAFNFPVAVWAWNAAIAAVCGNTMLWKPSPLTPLVSVAVQHLCNQVMADHKVFGVFNLVIGGNQEVAMPMVADKRLPLISFTGSTRVGRQVATVVAERLGRSLLELGGNNALIVEPDANLDLALRAIVFGAVGTAGQRCTTTRRLFLHRSIAGKLTDQLVNAYHQVVIGDPLDLTTLMGPLVTAEAVEQFEATVQRAVAEGGEVLVGGRRRQGSGFYVEPTIIKMPEQTAQVRQEAFVPILYLIEYDQLPQAMEWQNAVDQGLSSALFTNNLRSSELFLSAAGSDCGIANVNIGTSGAEIGGAFGGEKETGGGRESGSDAWKAYMRRQTNTINWSSELPLAQGIQFGD
jgi:aldehyde dehydrogenase (NAD+)